MTISYPIECPTTLKPGNVRWSVTTAVSLSVSPSTFQTTKYEYDGEGWVLDVSYPPLTRAEAAPFFGFLAALRGQGGTFLFGDTLLRVPQGTGAGTPLVKGANQIRTKVLQTDGWGASQTVLKAGDFFQIDNRLYMTLTDVESDALGNAGIDIFPKLRNHADNAPLILTDPKGMFRLAGDQQSVVDANNTKLFSIAFQAVEAL
jgi:hypothetical protein